jgi:mannan polymerase complexes MNN9 subunit
MKAKTKANSLIITVFSCILTIGFLWFFLFPPESPAPATQRPSRRDEGGSIIRFDLRNITSTSHALESRERILVLTPIARWYEEYWTNLLALTYPRELIDLGFILPKGDEGDNVLEQLNVHLRDIQGRTSYRGKFNHVTILRQDVELPTSQNEKGKSPARYLRWC